MRSKPSAGFTIIELLVVMAVIGLLLSLAVPRYLDSLDRGKSRVAEYNLSQIRKAIDQYRADRGAYPDGLSDLVERRYLRSLPLNPYTDRPDWTTVAPDGVTTGVFDVRLPPREGETSSAASQAIRGEP